MKILITGTSGFIGFHLAKSLLEDGHTVIGLDVENDYYGVSLKIQRREILKQNENFKFVFADISNKSQMFSLFKFQSPLDAVVNLAAQAGVRYSMTHPHVYQSSNIQGFLNILEACRHTGKPKVIYASSSSVYGGVEPPVTGFYEDMCVETPISLYAASKKSNELMAHCYSHLYDMETVGLRFFTVYGPWGRPDMMMWLFSEAMLKSEKINVFNHGKMKRDFTYIDDIVSGIKASITEKMPQKYNVFNLGNNKPEDLEHVISLLEKNLGVEADKNYMPMQPGDVPETCANINRAKETLGFEPQISVEQGVENFIAWFKEWKS